VKKNGWEIVSSELHFANAHLEVVTEHVRTPSRTQSRAWTVVHRKAAVVIAPMSRDGKIVLIRQERIPIRQAIWEMPAGQIDERECDENSIRAAALRELREECGHQLVPEGELVPLGYFFSSPAFTNEHSYLFLARHVEPASGGHMHTESESILDCRSFTPREIARMIATGEVRDANTLTVWARLFASGLLSLV
jgi:ADP-ribose pyrophosphatase